MANSITLAGDIIAGATASDPDLCRISGYLIAPSGSPLAGWGITVVGINCPVAFGSGSLVLKERTTIKSDADGFVQFDLIRGSQVIVEIPGFMTTLPASTLTVPDASSSDLIAFLFPYIVSVSFEDPGPLSVAVGDRLTVLMQATLSNGVVIDLSSGVVTVESSDEAVLVLMEGNTWEALSAGTANLTATAIDTSLVELHTDRYGVALEFLDAVTPTLPVSPVAVTVT